MGGKFGYAEPQRLLTAEELSRPRVRYFLYYPLALGGCALLLWIFPTDVMTGLCCAITTAIASLMMWQFLFTVQAIRLSTLLSMGLAIGYATGTLNSWLTMPRAGLTLASAVGQTPSELANGIAAAIMSCAVILLVGEFLEKPIWTSDHPLVITSGVKRILYINTGILALAAATGRVLQGGVQTTSSGKAGFVAVFLLFMLTPTIVIGTVVFLQEKPGLTKYLLGAIAIFLWLLALTQGRRELIYTPLACVAIARLCGYQWGRITWRRILLVGAGLAFVVLGALTYQLLRLAGDAVNGHGNLGVEAKQAQAWASQGQAWKIATTSSSSNLERRTLVSTFLSDLLHREKTQAPAYGRDLLDEIELAIPSAIFPGKPSLREEGIASETFHVFYTDQPNSILTAGVLDFGLWGLFLYPIALFFMYSVVLRLERTYFSYEVFFFILIAFLMVAMATEVEIEVYFELIRDSLIFSVFILGVAKLPVFGNRMNLHEGA